DELPRSRRRQRASVENRDEPERHGAERDAQKARTKEEVEHPPLDEEADAREDADEGGHDRDGRVERKPRVVQLVGGLQRAAAREQRAARREQADEEDLADEPGAVALGPSVLHTSLVGSEQGADKSEVTERVLIVDDHPLTRDALAALLIQQGFEVVGEAEDGASAISEADRLQPDLVLLDLTMPGMDGLTALPRIRQHAPGSEVVVLTASDAEENLLAAIRAGASGYLLKTEPPGQIATFLRGVARGDAALSGGVARRLLDRVRDGGRLSGVPEEVT